MGSASDDGWVGLLSASFTVVAFADSSIIGVSTGLSRNSTESNNEKEVSVSKIVFCSIYT